MLDTVYYENTLKEWLISLIIIIIGFIIIKGIVWLNKSVIKKLTRKTKTNLDDVFFDSLEKPILLAVMLISFWIAVARLHLGAKIHDIFADSYHILIILNTTWFFARLSSGLVELLASQSKNTDKVNTAHLNKRVIPLLKKTALTLIWIIGIVTALNNVGVKVTTLLGTLGIGGIAFALAAQDTIKNIFGGVTIFTDRPFGIGDTIKFDAIEGSVLDIGMRSTRVLTYDKRIITIANSKIMDAVVTNISSEPARRVIMKIGLTYNTDYEHMQQAIGLLKSLPQTIEEINRNNVTVSFSEFGDSALIITFIYFINKSADITQTTSKVNFEILKRFNDAKLDFAFPSQTVYVNKVEN